MSIKVQFKMSQDKSDIPEKNGKERWALLKFIRGDDQRVSQQPLNVCNMLLALGRVVRQRCRQARNGTSSYDCPEPNNALLVILQVEENYRVVL